MLQGLGKNQSKQFKEWALSIELHGHLKIKHRQQSKSEMDHRCFDHVLPQKINIYPKKQFKLLLGTKESLASAKHTKTYHIGTLL